MRLGVGQDAQHHDTSIGGSDGLTSLPAVFADASASRRPAPTDLLSNWPRLPDVRFKGDHCWARGRLNARQQPHFSTALNYPSIRLKSEIFR